MDEEAVSSRSTKTKSITRAEDENTTSDSEQAWDHWFMVAWTCYARQQRQGSALEDLGPHHLPSSPGLLGAGPTAT